jgi:hypothetical protein
VLKGLLWVAKGYRAWSVGIFAVAVIRLLQVGDAKAFWCGFLVLFPFATAIALSYFKGPATTRWLVAFLVLVDAGVILAPAHGIFPWLNLFPELPRTPNRILSWYFLVYGALQFGLAPPVFFIRSLQNAWCRGTPVVRPWICLFGLSVWAMLVFVSAMVIIKG